MNYSNLVPFCLLFKLQIIYLNVKWEEGILKFTRNILLLSAYLKRDKINDNEC